MNIYDLIEEEIRKHENIVIARHQGPDWDAIGSQIALKEAIKLKYPDKNVYAVGAFAATFKGIPKSDKEEKRDNQLLIVTDTPNISRIDIKDYSIYEDIVKIDHHPFIDKFSDLEIIETDKSSSSEIVFNYLIYNNYPLNEEIAKLLYKGIITDTGRFLFSLGSKTLEVSNYLINQFNLDTEKIYEEIYLRSLDQLRFQAYIGLNFKVTDNNLAYLVLDTEDLKKFNMDVANAGNVVNNFTYIDEFLVWTLATYDESKKYYKINIRSRGPVINKIAEKYGGGGHSLASGARIPELEDVKKLFIDLDKECERYKNEN